MSFHFLDTAAHDVNIIGQQLMHDAAIRNESRIDFSPRQKRLLLVSSAAVKSIDAKFAHELELIFIIQSNLFN